MKTKLFSALIIVAILGIALIGCKEDDPPPQAQKQPDTVRSLSFGTDCKVTIKSDDLFTTDEWNTLCDKVVAAVERGYGKYTNVGGFEDFTNKGIFEAVFSGNITIILLNSTDFDCEVKSSDYYNIYLKTSTLDTVDIQPAIAVMDAQTGKYPNE
jgi:hypothetical protein